MNHKKLRHINACICTLIFSLSLFLALNLAGCGNGGHTENPAFAPTVEPTVEPTINPTDEPTIEPTDEPTAEPTVQPTAEPTDEPTTEPTDEPTSEPTTEPTSEPTADPTDEPTTEPTSVEPDYQEIKLTGMSNNGEGIHLDEDSVLAHLGYTATYVDDKWHLYKDDQEVTSLVIPETFERDGINYKITGIASDTFYNCSLTSVTIPESVTSIDSYAFGYCNSLASITIPEGVTSIGDHVFWGCHSLTSITVPEGVTSLGELAFGSCSSLATITWKDTSYTDPTEFNNAVSGISGGEAVWW